MLMFPSKPGSRRRSGIALGGSQVFAVGGIDEQPIGHRLGGGDAAVEPRGIGPLRQDPPPTRFDPDLAQDGGERHSGPFGAAGPAVGELHRGAHRGLGPLREGIPGALQEVGHRDRGKALEVVHREERGALDQAMDQEPMLARVDGRDAPEVDLVEEGIGRDGAGHVSQGGEADDRVGGEADDALFARGPFTVGRGRGARRLHPRGHVRR